VGGRRVTLKSSQAGPHSPRRDAICQKRRYRWCRKRSLFCLPARGWLPQEPGCRRALPARPNQSVYEIGAGLKQLRFSFTHTQPHVFIRRGGISVCFLDPGPRTRHRSPDGTRSCGAGESAALVRSTDFTQRLGLRGRGAFALSGARKNVGSRGRLTLQGEFIAIRGLELTLRERGLAPRPRPMAGTPRIRTEGYRHPGVRRDRR
jgi:hypothetical protein